MAPTARPGRGTRAAIAVMAGLNAVGAAGGGVCMAVGVLDLGSEVTARVPWASPVLGGIALLLWVAVPNAVLTVLAVRADDRTAAASVTVGLLLVAWIVVELAFIRELSFLHPLYVVIGLVLVGLGLRLRSEVSPAPRPR